MVEDEPTDRVILAKFLEQAGHEVYFASDGEEALKTYLKNSIEITIIAVSGKGPDQLDAAQSAGARVALSKPTIR
jgi:DNA-binding response OmpR family regulator